MATTTDVLRRDFRVGGVLVESFAVYLRQFAPFTVLALMVTLPSTVNSYLMVAAETSSASIEGVFSGVWWIASMVGGLALYGLLQGAVCYGTFQYLRGQPVSIGEVVRHGIGLILPVIGVAIVLSIVIGFGIVLLIVPGLILYTMYWVAMPVAAIERPGVMTSLRRSADLTRGHRWRVFGLLVIIMILGIVFNAIVAAVVAVMALAAGIGPYLIAQWIVGALVYAFGAVIGTVSYYHLRAVKEGTDVEAIARVFD